MLLFSQLPIAIDKQFMVKFFENEFSMPMVELRDCWLRDIISGNTKNEFKIVLMAPDADNTTLWNTSKPVTFILFSPAV